MLLHPPAGSARRAWWAVAGWVLSLYIGVFYARAVQALVERTVGRDAFLALAGAIVLGGLLWLVRWLRRNRPSFRFYAAAGFAAALYLGGVWHLRRAPEEAMHLLEYGGLSLLAFRALAFSLRDPLVYVAAASLSGLVGTGDEIIQWLAPNRSFDFRDITINVLAGLGIQLLLALVLRPAWVRRPLQPRSWVVAGGLVGAWSLVLLGCFSNTLERQTRYLASFTGLPASMRAMTDAMVEYGYLHRDPAFGAFYSRLAREDLQRQDQARASGAAASLRASREPGGHERFAASVTGVSDPFLYELYIHLFRRDRYAREAVQLRRTPDRARYAATIAYRENQIIERVFPKTLAASGRVLRPDHRDIIEQLADRVTPHVSAVSSQLMTRFRQAHAVALFGSLTIAAWSLAPYNVRRSRRPHEPLTPSVPRP